MSTEIASSTSTHLAQPPTNNRTIIAWHEYDENWTPAHAGHYWPADYLYSRKEDYYRHLDDINAGRKNGPTWWNQPCFTYSENKDLIEILAGHLELTICQKERAVQYFLHQDLQMWGLRKELVAWATCAYIVHSDEQDVRQCHPLTKLDRSDGLFLKAAYHLDLSKKDRLKTYGKVQHDLG